MKKFNHKPSLAKFACAFAVFTLTALLAGCADRFPSMYVVELPQLPSVWVSILGEPHWRLEWVNAAGEKQIAELSPSRADGRADSKTDGGGKPARIEIEIPVIWASPVTASPFWPEFNLFPGLFKPAGAIFPFDASGSRLPLTWEAGVDTVFYWELALAYNQNARIPPNFNWQRFRELFETDALSKTVSADPWIVDWRSVAERTAASGFDRRRLVPEPTTPTPIPVPAGYWYGASPFAKPLFFAEGENPIFPVRSGMNVWFSAHGVLRVSGTNWLFHQFAP